jgi:cytochrome c oxidase cbb3-type subunit 2
VAKSIHTSHRLILGIAASVYLVLVGLTAVLPAMESERQDAEQRKASAEVPEQPGVTHGRELYIAYGCWNCHTQQIRGDERKEVKGKVPVLPVDLRFGLERASRAEDYSGQDPPLLGTQRTGPDLMGVGGRLPGADWHHWHLYDPRAVSPDSSMPALRWLYRTREEDAQPGDVPVPYIDALDIPSKKLWATPDAQDLVEYLLSLRARESR